MKKFLSVFLLAVLYIPQVSAFRDIAPNSPLLPAVQYLIEKGALDDGAFFRADDDVPAKMFWPLVLREAGFDPESATFSTPLPPNVEEDDEMAQYLREAIRRRFIRAEGEFDGDEAIKKLDAIKILVQTKGISTPNRVTRTFLDKVEGVTPSFRALPYVEAAYASHLIGDDDIAPLQPYRNLTRRDLVMWLYNFSQDGEKKSSLEYQTQENLQRMRSLRDRDKKTTEEQTSEKSSTTPSKTRGGNGRIQIQILGNGSRGSSATTTSSKLPNLNVMEAIYDEILNSYRFAEDVTPEKKEDMMDEAMAAFVKALGDKYSSYIEPSKSEEFKQGLDGKFEGIGAYVEMIEKEFTITAPIKGSPAEAAGIEAGDVVIKVDGEDITGESVTDIVNKIKGPAGSTVKLTILRKGTEKEVEVVRGKITVPSITVEWHKSIPVIGVHQFNNSTQVDFEKILKKEVLPKNPRGIVLDLRNNPGGFLTSAVKMGEFFVKQGDLIFSVEERNSRRDYRSSRTGELETMQNIIILTNKGTASASEILAGMLQDYGKARIVGSQTLGKGTVQEVLNYSNGGILRLTIAKWLTPNGRWIQEKEPYGLKPDIEVEDPTSEERKEKIDKQRDRAVAEVLGR